MEKLSYALGLIIGNNLKGMNIEGLLTTEFTARRRTKCSTVRKPK